MPARNSLKPYVDGSYYHIYNRGVEKRLIFQDKQDYAVYLSYLKTYLLPKNEIQLQKELANENTSPTRKSEILSLLRLNNFADEIKLLTYCLIPNHFHFLIKQKSAKSIDMFINSLNTRYVMYFNKKNKRVGPLYQGVYKAVLVESDEQLIYLSSYIHRNPAPKIDLASKGEAFQTKFHLQLLKQPSSYLDYLGKRRTEWVHPEEILSFFSKRFPSLSYQSFVEQTNDYSIIRNLKLE